MQILRRHALRKGDFKLLKEQLSKIIEGSIDLLFKKGAELVITDSYELYAEDKKVLAFKVDERIIPSLRALNEGIVKLPTITGYILAGVVIGSSGLKLIRHENMEILYILSEITLSFIAVIIGGEFSFSTLKLYGKKIPLNYVVSTGIVWAQSSMRWYFCLQQEISG